MDKKVQNGRIDKSMIDSLIKQNQGVNAGKLVKLSKLQHNTKV